MGIKEKIKALYVDRGNKIELDAKVAYACGDIGLNEFYKKMGKAIDKFKKGGAALRAYHANMILTYVSKHESPKSTMDQAILEVIKSEKIKLDHVLWQRAN